jgi:hypothetical protein
VTVSAAGQLGPDRTVCRSSLEQWMPPLSQMTDGMLGSARPNWLHSAVTTTHTAH